MATIDELFETMATEDTGPEYLVIDPVTRQIFVPETQEIFGVEADTNSTRKYFQAPRYVGDNLDLAACFLSVIYRNANGEKDEYLVEDVAVTGDTVTFSWLLSSKVVAYMGPVQFRVYADTGAGKDWGTTLATGTSLEGLEPEEVAVEEGTSDVVTQLRAMVGAQTAAVANEGAAQVQAVGAAGNAATAAAEAQIEAKGAATLATIPADYTALQAQADKLTRDRAAAIVCQAEGTTVQVHDASDDPLQGLRIFGRSTQDGTPTPDAPVEIVSLPAPVVGVYGKNLCPESALDTMGINGTQNAYDTATRTITMLEDPTGFAGRYCAPFKKMVVGERYTLSFSIRGTPGKIVKCGWDKQGIPVTLTDSFVRYGVTLVATRENEPIVFYSRPVANGGLTAGEYMQFADVQIEVGGVSTEYEPYKEAQTLTITTPEGLPGIPVASGGNYTDADGQQWITDEVDLARGVYVQRVKATAFDGSENWYQYQLHDNRVIYSIYTTGERAIKVEKQYSNLLRFNWTVGESTPLNSFAIGATGGVYAVLDLDAFPDVDSWKSFLAGNNMKAQYILATPIETPLTDAEIQTYRTLRSCKPTTTMLTDAGAHMALEYAADPKTYIDNKLAALGG